MLVGSGGFATIQAAVDAAHDGDTILVASGTYVEQVVVNHLNNLTIKAAVGATVTLQAPADLHETARSSSDREANSVLTVENGTGITIDHIHVDGHGVGNTVDEGTAPARPISTACSSAMRRAACSASTSAASAIPIRAALRRAASPWSAASSAASPSASTMTA